MNNNELNRDNIVDFILQLFENRGAEEYMGESVSMAQHMEQSAACAAADGAPETLVIASLLHDIGHFVGDFPVEALENGINNLHEDAGANFLAPYFPAEVTEPIRLHVAAKKYLCAVDNEYIKRLSDASINSLNVQGGPMTADEVKSFEANPHHLAAVKTRYYDDDGKVLGLHIKQVKDYRDQLEANLTSINLQFNNSSKSLKMKRIQQFHFDNNELTINWGDGRQSQLAAIWLRDHCQMPQSRDPLSGQRLLNITDIPTDLTIANVSRTDDSVIVDFDPDGHQSEFSIDWLLDNCYCINNQGDDFSEAHKTLWQKSDFDRNLPRYDYGSFCSSADTKIDALQSVKDYGFAVLKNVPCEAGEILKVISEFGFVRETNYGPLFEVRTKVDANNLAFTNLGLGCHLDNPYRNPVPGIQLLHCLQSSAAGGESILQDGFKAASILRDENPQHFDILCNQWVTYRFQDAETDLQSRVPMIELNDNREITKVRYNNRSIGTLNLAPEKVRAFYAAYRHYAELLHRKDLQISFKLDPGELMIFDNTRVMHARTAFSDGGTRHLQGAYSDLDGLYSTLSVLKSKLSVSHCAHIAQ